MVTTSKPSSAPAKTVAVASKTTLKKPSVKSVLSKEKPSVTTKVAAKSATAKPTTAATAVHAKAPAVTVKTPASAPAPESKTLKTLKAKKVKLVRDSYTIPKSEYLVLDDLKLRATELKHPIKKGELLRAGIKALAAMTTTQFHSALQAVPALKTGRPSK